MPSDKPQIIKLSKHSRRKEWGRFDLEESDVKPKERERVFCKSSATDNSRLSDRASQVREL